MPLFRRGRSAEARDALPPLAEVEQRRERPEEVEDEAAMLQEMQEELSRLAAENHRMRDETRKYLRETDQREADLKEQLDEVERELDEYRQLVKQLQTRTAPATNAMRVATAPLTRPTRTMSEFERPGSSLSLNALTKRNDSLMAENSRLREEVSRLRQENTDLLLMAKDAQTDSQVLHSQVMTTYNSKVELYRRLDKTKRDYRQLDTEMTRLAARITKRHQTQRSEEEAGRWAHIDAMTQESAGTMTITQFRPPAKHRQIRVEAW